MERAHSGPTSGRGAGWHRARMRERRLYCARYRLTRGESFEKVAASHLAAIRRRRCQVCLSPSGLRPCLSPPPALRPSALKTSGPKLGGRATTQHTSPERSRRERSRSAAPQRDWPLQAKLSRARDFNQAPVWSHYGRPQSRAPLPLRKRPASGDKSDESRDTKIRRSDGRQRLCPRAGGQVDSSPPGRKWFARLSGKSIAISGVNSTPLTGARQRHRHQVAANGLAISELVSAPLCEG